MAMNSRRGLFGVSAFRGRNKYKKIASQHAINATPNAKLAIVIHLYYEDMWPVICSRLKYIDVPFDLYISVQEKDKEITIEKLNRFHGTTNILTFPNKGRDVLPFLLIAKLLQSAGTYQYFLKLHTKRSLHRTDGNEWMESLLNELIPKNITPIIKTLEKSDTGAIGPQSHVVSLTRHLHPNRENIEKDKLKISSIKRVCIHFLAVLCFGQD
jgi:lipopolysaccharide biosynthesis protein